MREGDREREREREWVEFPTSLFCAMKNERECKHEYGNLFSHNIWREQKRKLMELKYDSIKHVL